MKYRIVEIKKKFYLQRWFIIDLAWTTLTEDGWLGSYAIKRWIVFNSFDEAREELEFFIPKVISTF